MKNDINEKFRIMPFFHLLHDDSDFDELYVFKGFVLLFSIILLPITFPLYCLGRFIFKTR